MSLHTASVRLGHEAYLTSVKSEGHELLVDEPVELGGGNEGPSPYAYLLAALGSCKAITASMYARRKGWDLRAVEVELEHDRHEGYEQITARLRFEGELTGEQRARLAEIAGRCPVERTITGDLRVTVVSQDP